MTSSIVQAYIIVEFNLATCKDVNAASDEKHEIKHDDNKEFVLGKRFYNGVLRNFYKNSHINGDELDDSNNSDKTKREAIPSEKWREIYGVGGKRNAEEFRLDLILIKQK